MAFLDKCRHASERFIELEKMLADNTTISNQAEYTKIAKEYSEISVVVTMYRKYQDILRQLDELKVMAKDKHDLEFEELAALECEALEEKKSNLEDDLSALINPVHDEKDRNLIFEIRAGTGGEEASLFAADLYRMYTRYAVMKGWEAEMINLHESETGGIKEVIFSISGPGASKSLKWESGVHRVQRVPTTEASGRIHTSAATVAVMFEPEEMDFEIESKDIRTDIFRSSGPGGQSVNTTDSAVRLTHIPTGIIASCQDERSQLKNKAKAMRVLRARIQDRMEQENKESQAQDRKSKVGSGDRSEKIRTYNYPDRRVTDHRIGFTTHKLQYVMEGELDEIVEALQKAAREESKDE